MERARAKNFQCGRKDFRLPVATRKSDWTWVSAEAEDSWMRILASIFKIRVSCSNLAVEIRSTEWGQEWTTMLLLVMLSGCTEFCLFAALCSRGRGNRRPICPILSKILYSKRAFRVAFCNHGNSDEQEKKGKTIAPAAMILVVPRCVIWGLLLLGSGGFLFSFFWVLVLCILSHYCAKFCLAFCFFMHSTLGSLWEEAKNKS